MTGAQGEHEDGLFDGGPIVGTPRHTIWTARMGIRRAEGQGNRWGFVALILSPLWVGVIWAGVEFLVGRL